MKYKYTKTQKKIIVVYICILSGMLFFMHAIHLYSKDMRENLYRNSTQNIREIYTQVNEKFSQLMRMQKERLELCATYISDNSGEEDALRNDLQQWEERWNYSEFDFLNEKGEVCDLDGNIHSAQLQDQENWKVIFSGDTAFSVDKNDKDGESYMFAAIPVTKGEYKGFFYQAISFGISSEKLDEELGVHAFNGAVSCYITDQDGKVLFAPKDSQEVGDNLLTYLKDGNVHGKHSPTVPAIWEADSAAQLALELNGEEYYFVYMPMEYGNWRLAAFVPAQVMDSSLRHIQKITAFMSSAVFFLTILLILVLGSVYYRREIGKNRREIEWRNILFDVLSQHMDDVYLLRDQKLQEEVYVSGNIKRILGISPEKADGLLHDIRVLVQNPDHELKKEEVDALPSGSQIVQECWMKCKGTDQIKLIRQSVYHMKNEEHDFLIFIFSDRSQEMEIREHIQDALHAAQVANASKSDFLANMSHDIRTPMNAIMGMTHLIEHEADSPEKVREYVKKIDFSSRHLLGIINDVLDMSKIDSGKTVLNMETFRIFDLIEQIKNIFQGQAQEKSQTFTVICNNLRHEWLSGDHVRIMQILSNILSNAVKYTPLHGTICFEAEEMESQSDRYAKICFRVTDNGIGMSREFQEKIFDSFAREENFMTSHIQGTGLGMAIAKNLTELMGGTIQVESIQGEGSCFEVMLDLEIAKQNHIQELEEKSQQTKGEFSLKGIKFLCAEDNELNAEILTELLRLEGASCKICENGEAVVHQFETSMPGAYDMILMDIQMPLMNGYEAAEKIRNSTHPMAAEIPIIAMTANAFSEDIQKSLNSGMTAHLSKPIDMKILKQTIENIRLGGGKTHRRYAGRKN